jgi:pimeloyl-ACP methyl ester carboxylesterase
MQDSGFLDVPNARLYYEVAGAGAAVVFVHGFTLDTRMWDDQWTVFGERYRIVRYDVRGFGRSQAEPVPYSDLDDLLALLNFLDIERAHLVGLSMGGIVVVHFALTHPRRLRGLVAADCGPSGLTGPVDALSDAEGLAAAGRIAEALEKWLANPVFVPARERRGVAARLQEIVSDYTWWRARHPGLRRGLQPPAAGLLDEISAPTLVIVGERDVPRVQAASNALATGIRGARLVVLHGVGHMSNMEDPEAFNSAVLSFLAEL